MSKKGPARSASKKAISGSKDPKQAKRRKEVSYDHFKDPLDKELALVGLRVKQTTAGKQQT